MTEFYVIDTRTNEIVNCITTDRLGTGSQFVLDRHKDSEFLRLDANPPRSMLEKYRYWSERP